MKLPIQVYYWIATVFFIGHLPLASGTWGSAAALITWYFIPEMNLIVFSSVIIILFILGLISAKKVAEHENNRDPPKVVIDEWVGMWIALLIVPKTWQWITGSFLLFRFFDISKLFPMRQIEKLKKGWGIMLDDVVAGIYTLLILLIIRNIR